MLSPLQQSASNLKTTHLLRSLLREATYIPDANARQYFGRYILNRFKAYHPAKNATTSLDGHALDKYRHRTFQKRKSSVIVQRTRETQRKAQKGLNYLRRANQGELPCLRKVLLYAYGRMGARRYQLLAELLKPEVTGSDHVRLPASQDAPAALQQLYYSDKRFLSFFDAPKMKNKDEFTIEISDRYSRLKTVVKSQVQASSAISRPMKKSLLLTPIRNVWERPMPIRRARNNVKRWYVETMSKLLPPLPNPEYNRLQAMIAGERWIEFAKPRTPALELRPLAIDEAARSREVIEAGMALNKPSKADRPWGIQRPHNITVRFMRRLYAKILALSCKLEWSKERKKWNAVWGNTPIKAKSYTNPVDKTLFAGVNANGQLLERRASTTRRRRDLI